MRRPVSLSKISVLLIKTTFQGANQFWPAGQHATTWIFLALFISLGAVQLTVLNSGLSKYDALFIIPIFYVMTTIEIMLAGLLLYKTYENFTVQVIMPRSSPYFAGAAILHGRSSFV